MEELAKQGLGYFLFVGSLVVLQLRENYYQKVIQQKDTKIDEISKSWVNDIKEVINSTNTGMQGLRDIAKTTLTIVENLQAITVKK